MSADPAAAAATLVLELTEEELARVERGDVLDLAELHRRRTAAMREVPAVPAEPVKAKLRLAVALQARVTERLRERMDETAHQLGRVGRGRTAVQGYTPAGAPVRRTLDRTA